MPDPAVSLLRDLISIDSVNPTLVPGAAGEAKLAERVADELQRAGLDVTVREAAPGRPNVVGVLDGRDDGPTLMLCGHLDTVGVEGMSAPFDPVLRDGRVYGRGAQDMKGGLAAMLDAAGRIARGGSLRAGRLVVAALADEEAMSVGAEALVKEWRADAAVIGEPTSLEIAVGHKGFAWLEVVTEGRAAHGSRPADGRDAIAHAGRVLGELEALDRRLREGPAHPLVGTGSLHASFVNGGREWSTYPDRCSLKYERRTAPNEDGALALAEAKAILDRLRTADPDFRAEARLDFERSPYVTPAAHPLPALLEECLGRKAPRTAMSFWTDAGLLGPAGIPCVVFGPGGAGLHSAEEYVLVDDVLACRDAFERLAPRYCAG
ncbi:MAG: ArgE/DapE family deacylase [Vicinamibacteria bacterium]